jgi:hypothetical protein
MVFRTRQSYKPFLRRLVMASVVCAPMVGMAWRGVEKRAEAKHAQSHVQLKPSSLLALPKAPCSIEEMR